MQPLWIIKTLRDKSCGPDSELGLTVIERADVEIEQRCLSCDHVQKPPEKQDLLSNEDEMPQL